MNSTTALGLRVAALSVVLFIPAGCNQNWCPCGFDWNSSTNGCQVHLGPVNCGNGGSNNAGNNPSGGGANPAPTTGGVPPISTSYCNIAACTYDFPTQTVSVVYQNASGSKYPPGTPGQPVDIAIKESRVLT